MLERATINLGDSLVSVFNWLFYLPNGHAQIPIELPASHPEREESQLQVDCRVAIFEDQVWGNEDLLQQYIL